MLSLPIALLATAALDAPPHLPVGGLAPGLAPELAAEPTSGPRSLDPSALAKPRVRFQGKSYKLDKLPDEVGEPAREAIYAWWPWIEEHDFHPLLTADQSALLVLPKKSLLSKREKLAEKLTERLNELAPQPGQSPEEARPRWMPAQELPLEAIEALPGRDALTAVLVELQGPKLADELGAYLEQLHPDLEGWGSSSLVGGVVSDMPPISVTVDGDGQEEYEAENEVVHRMTRTLLARRFGLLPYSIQSGLAWALEYELCGNHYCFPFRDDFVFEVEHGSWAADVRSRFHRRKKEPVTAKELFGFQRRTFDLEEAQLAFALGHYLIEVRAEELPELLEVLRTEWERTVIEVKGSNWTYRPELEINVDRLAELSIEVLGADLLEDATTHFRKGVR